MLDEVIRGGTVVDGTGNAAVTADVGIRDGRIVAIGKVNDEAAHETKRARVAAKPFGHGHERQAGGAGGGRERAVRRHTAALEDGERQLNLRCRVSDLMLLPRIAAGPASRRAPTPAAAPA